jgi:hypothetical protein
MLITQQDAVLAVTNAVKAHRHDKSIAAAGSLAIRRIIHNYCRRRDTGESSSRNARMDVEEEEEDEEAYMRRSESKNGGREDRGDKGDLKGAKGTESGDEGGLHMDMDKASISSPRGPLTRTDSAKSMKRCVFLSNVLPMLEVPSFHSPCPLPPWYLLSLLWQRRESKQRQVVGALKGVVGPGRRVQLRQKPAPDTISGGGRRQRGGQQPRQVPNEPSQLTFFLHVVFGLTAFLFTCFVLLPPTSTCLCTSRQRRVRGRRANRHQP